MIMAGMAARDHFTSSTTMDMNGILISVTTISWTLLAIFASGELGRRYCCFQKNVIDYALITCHS
jgi:hypothetical protein